jgi:hypothetical protein
VPNPEKAPFREDCQALRNPVGFRRTGGRPLNVDVGECPGIEVDIVGLKDVAGSGRAEKRQFDIVGPGIQRIPMIETTDSRVGVARTRAMRSKNSPPSSTPSLSQISEQPVRHR